jgi:hypothetical protein
MKMFAVMNVYTGDPSQPFLFACQQTRGRGLSLHSQSQAQAAAVPCGEAQ